MNGHGQVADVPTPVQAPAAAVSFDGRRGELAALLAGNLLLTVATLGIYRFWAKTRMRGFLWRHVKLLGEPLEYLGTGTELLIGFLIALVVLAPVTSAFSLLPFLIPDTIPHRGLILQVLYYAMLWFLLQVAIYRVRRYRLTRTAWRGVRFGLDGSSFIYALIWFLYGLLTLATLGLAYPWLRVATTRYFARHARFGATGCSFDGSAGPLFRLWWVVIAPALAAVFLFVANNGESFELIAAAWSDYLGKPDRTSLAELVRSMGEVHYRSLWLVLPSLIILTWYRVNEFRYLLSAVRVGEVRLDSRLKTAPVYVLQFVFYGCVLGAAVFLGVSGVSAVRAVAELIGASDTLSVGVIVIVIAGLLYLLYGLSKKLFVEITLLKLACATLTLERPEALERTVQSTTALPGHGEGLADALDVGGF